MPLLRRRLPAPGLGALLDEAIGLGLQLTLSISGPVTASGQHFAWLNPLLDTGWFGWLSVTDAICYHDGHRALASVREGDFRQVPIFGDDGRLRDEQIIRIADIGFPESVLLDTDAWLCHLLRQPEFQRRMTGCEFRSAGRHCGQRAGGGGCSRCADVPLFVGAPADGSVFQLDEAAEGAARARATVRLRADLNGGVQVCAYRHHCARGEEHQPDLGGGVPRTSASSPARRSPSPQLREVAAFSRHQSRRRR
jgi:deoxyhypusine synthase